MKLIYAGLLLLAISVSAQAQNKQPYTYILEDGSTLASGNLDSLKKAWGEGRVALQHTTEDDAKGIIHVVKMTDEMMKEMQTAAMERMRKLAAMTGKPAPAFSLADLDGKTWSLEALRGKVVVLNFWFNTCPPCIAEMPALNELVKSYAGKDVVFLAPAFNTADQVHAFLEKHPFNYTILPASEAMDQQYDIHSWPSSFVIGKDGNVLLATGSSPDIRKQLSAVIDQAL